MTCGTFLNLEVKSPRASLTRLHQAYVLSSSEYFVGALIFVLSSFETKSQQDVLVTLRYVKNTQYKFMPEKLLLPHWPLFII